MARIPILDHGYIEIVTTWGSDESIVEAARMSTGKGFLGWGGATQCKHCGGSEWKTECPAGSGSCLMGAFGPPGDEKLLRFLWTHNHHTPFEMAGAQIEVQAPIIVFREWHRHRTQSYNEASARYAPLPAVDYLPTVVRILINAGGSNKQAGTVTGSQALTSDAADAWLRRLAEIQTEAEAHYQAGLAAGVPKELARLSMTVGRYSKMRAQAVLRNWLGFLALRDDVNAQWEIRQYAGALRDVLANVFPRTMAIFSESRASIFST